MSRYCGNCGAPLNAAALAAGRCQSCGAPIRPALDSTAPTRPGFPPPSAGRGANRPMPGWLRNARAIGLFLLFALLVAALLAVLVQRLGFQVILAPSASSSSGSSADSNSSSQIISGAAATATATRRATPPLSASPGASPTAGQPPTPSASPTATPVPATLDVKSGQTSFVG